MRRTAWWRWRIPEATYHANHPDGGYRIANRVQLPDRQTTRSCGELVSELAAPASGFVEALTGRGGGGAPDRSGRALA